MVGRFFHGRRTVKSTVRQDRFDFRRHYRTDRRDCRPQLLLVAGRVADPLARNPHRLVHRRRRMVGLLEMLSAARLHVGWRWLESSSPPTLDRARLGQAQGVGPLQHAHEGGLERGFIGHAERADGIMIGMRVGAEITPGHVAPGAGQVHRGRAEIGRAHV